MKSIATMVDATLKQMLRIAGSMLREIFDESAYSRFLERRNVPTSRHAYAEFLRENEYARARRPRCC